MKRFGTIAVVVLLLGTMAPGAGELLENTVHLIQEGHVAHAAPDGDYHGTPNPEHGCTGAIHLCSCCISFSFLPSQVAAQVPDPEFRQLVSHIEARPPANIVGGLFHPPRA